MIIIDYIADEIRIMTDWYTDDIFSHDGAERIVHPVSRLITDPERFRDDSKERMASAGMGAVYTRTSRGDGLIKEKQGYRDNVLKRYYDSFHSALGKAVEKELSEYGKALIVDCHSFSSTPLPHESDKTFPRPDFCIGADPFHTPDALLGLSLGYFTDRGFKAKADFPFSIAPVPMECWSLNMDEESTEKLPSYNEVKDIVRGFLSLLYFTYGHS